MVAARERGSSGLDERGAPGNRSPGSLASALPSTAVDPAGKLRPLLRERGRLLVHVRPHDRHPRGPGERRLAGQTLVQHAAERVLVGAAVDIRPL